MDVKIIVALISSIAALVSAVFSVIISARNQKRQAAEIEKLKFTLEEERIRQQKERERKQDAQNSIDLALQYTQKLKDAIHFIEQQDVINHGSSLEWLKHTRSEIMKYMELFSIIFQKLNGMERDRLHDLKKQLLGLDMILSYTINRIEEEHAQIPVERIEKTQLDHILKEITRVQDFLFIRKDAYWG